MVPINESSPNAFDESDGGAWGSSEDWDWEEGWDEVEEKEEEDDSALPTLVGENGDYHHDSEELGEGIFSFRYVISPFRRLYVELHWGETRAKLCMQPRLSLSSRAATPLPNMLPASKAY